MCSFVVKIDVLEEKGWRRVGGGEGEAEEALVVFL